MPFGNMIDIDGITSKLGGMSKKGLDRLNNNLEQTNKLKAIELVLSLDKEESVGLRQYAINELSKFFF